MSDERGTINLHGRLTLERLAEVQAELAQVKEALVGQREVALKAVAELAQVKTDWAEDDARLLRAEEGWAEAVAARDLYEQAGHDTALERDAWKQLSDENEARNFRAVNEKRAVVAERDTAIRHLHRLVDSSPLEHEEAWNAARAFLTRRHNDL